MVIYPNEKSIENKVLANKTKAFSSPVKIINENTDLLIESLEKLKANKTTSLTKSLAKLDPEHPDMMYGSAILVSTVMNENDDLFLPDETWKAKDTPVNTPYNDNHVEDDIIGHIIASRAFDKDGKPITESDPPNYFDIEVDFVLYASIFPEIAADVYENGPKGKKFVSMECTFENFSYALVDFKNKMYIVDRNEDTSFLTKHLRAYGGSGSYGEYKKIGRVLKDFRFVGMGNVDEPANPASKYTELVSLEKTDKVKSNKTFIYITKGTNMTVESLEQAKSVIAELTAKLETLEKSESNKAVETLKAEKTQINDQLVAEKGKVQVVSDELTKAKQTISDLEKKVSDTEAKIAEFEKKATQAAKDASDQKRTAQLNDLTIPVSNEQKSKYLTMSEDVFANFIEFASLAKEKYSKKDDKQKDKDKKDEEDEKTAKDKKDKSKSELDKSGEAETEASKVLEAAKKETDPDLTATSGKEEDKPETTLKVAERLIASLRKSNKGKIKSVEKSEK